jgi:hypothetical protein
MANPRRNWFRLFLFSLLIFVIWGFIWPFVDIQLRLSRNGKIVGQVVEALKARFPEMNLRGTASYRSEDIYITIFNRLDEAERKEVERWLREHKVEQGIAPQMWLRFNDDDWENRILIK